MFNTADGSEALRLRALHGLDILDTAPEERFDRITRLATEIFGVPMASVTFIDKDRQWRKSEQGLGGNTAPREGAFCGVTVERGEAYVVEDASRDPDFRDNPFVAGDPHLRFYAGEPLREPGGVPVGTLCILDTEPRTLDAQQQQVLRDLADLVQHELVRDDQISRAALVQSALLPAAAPDIDGWQVQGFSLPHDRVGGDFYDWSFDESTLRLVVGDVMGKGFGAALLAAATRAALRAVTWEDGVSSAVSRAAASLDRDLERLSSFVTLFAATIDPATGRVDYVDAGHNLALVVRRDGGFDRITSTGTPLGVLLDQHLERHTLHLNPGDTLLVVSDGLFDLLGSDDTAFERLEGLVRERVPAAQRVEAIRRVAPREIPLDDLTAVSVRRSPS